MAYRACIKLALALHASVARSSLSRAHETLLTYHARPYDRDMLLWGLNYSSRMQQRQLSASIESVHAQIDNVNDLFVEARDLIEDARDEAETVYFNEAHAEAKEAVDKTVHLFDSILDSLSESERSKLQRMMGLKIQQLKAEVNNLDTLHA